MRESKKTKYLPAALIVLALCFRFVSNKFDFDWISTLTPIGAILLLAGTAQKDQRWILSTLAMLGILICDFAINLFVYEGKYGLVADGWWLSYLLFAILIFIAGMLPIKNSLAKLGLGALTISLVYWIFSDLTYLITIGTDISTGERLPMNIKGFSIVLFQGFPFARNFFMGTILYSVVFFAIQLLVNQTQKKLALSRN